MWKSSNKKRGRRAHDHCLLSHKTNVFKVKLQCKNYLKYCICSTKKFGVFGVIQIYNPMKIIMPWKILQWREEETRAMIVCVVVLRAKANKKKRKEIWKLGDLSLTFETIPPTHVNWLDVTCSQGKQNIILYSIQNIQNFNTS